MTYEESEVSRLGGKPFELYKFSSDDGDWFFTSSDQMIEFNSDEYEPVTIIREQFEVTDDAFRSDIKLTMGRNNDLVVDFLNMVINSVVTLTIFRGHFGIEAESVVLWKGRIISFDFKESDVLVACESIFSSLRTPGLQPKYQYLCRHSLYFEGCNVAKASYLAANLEVADVTGFNVTMTDISVYTGYAADWFRGGYLQYGHIYLFIEAHNGNVLTVDRRVPFDAGVLVDLYPGCNHTMTHCIDKFNNYLNFGGFPWIPTKNPFSDLGGKI
jgi:uncharacterized phage protein (TIGR02218 family)